MKSEPEMVNVEADVMIDASLVANEAYCGVYIMERALKLCEVAINSRASLDTKYLSKHPISGAASESWYEASEALSRAASSLKRASRAAKSVAELWALPSGNATSLRKSEET